MTKQNSTERIWDFKIKITFKCPVTGKFLSLDHTAFNNHITGGCSGHFSEDEYCYCNSPELFMDLYKCPECGKHHSLSPF